jgi:hypothetical protein
MIELPAAPRLKSSHGWPSKVQQRNQCLAGLTRCHLRQRRLQAGVS